MGILHTNLEHNFNAGANLRNTSNDGQSRIGKVLVLLLVVVVDSRCVFYFTFFFYFHSIAFYNGDEMLKLCGSAKNYIHQVGELTIKYVTHAMCGRTQKPMSKTSTRSARVQCVCVCVRASEYENDL